MSSNVTEGVELMCVPIRFRLGGMHSILKKYGIEMDYSYILSLLEEFSAPARKYVNAHIALSVAQSENPNLEDAKRDELIEEMKEHRYAINKFLNDEHFINTLAVSRNLSINLADKIEELDNIATAEFDKVSAYTDYGYVIQKNMSYDITRAGASYHDELQKIKDLKVTLKDEVKAARKREKVPLRLKEHCRKIKSGLIVVYGISKTYLKCAMLPAMVQKKKCVSCST